MRLLPILLLGLAAGLAGCTKPPPPAPQASRMPPPPEALPPSETAAMCVRPAEHAAFDVSALRNFLVVAAITCKAEDRYNDVVGRFQSDLSASEKTLDTYFARAYGRRARSAEDDYNTQLISAQSQYSSRSGSLFCAQTLSLFDQVMALQSGAELAQLAVSRPIQRAMAVQDCPAAPPPAAPKTAPKKKP
jgi:hypothetical protein